MSTPGGTKICKVCGVEYPYCHTNIQNQYRWQDVACCKEHAAEYFAAIAASRNESLDSIPDEFTSLLNKSDGKSKIVETPVNDIVEDIVEMVVEPVETRKRSRRKYLDYE